MCSNEMLRVKAAPKAAFPSFPVPEELFRELLQTCILLIREHTQFSDREKAEQEAFARVS